MTHRLCKCGAIVKNRCEKCNPHAKKNSVNYTSAWDKLSRRFRKENPLCQVCEKNGFVTAATEVHHIVKVADDPSRLLDVTNLMSVCRGCHEKIERSTEIW